MKKGLRLDGLFTTVNSLVTVGTNDLMKKGLRPGKNGPGKIGFGKWEQMT